MARLARLGIVAEAGRTPAEVDSAITRLGGAYGNDRRTRPMVTLTLSPEALTRLDAIAAERGQTRSGAVEQLVRNARVREAK
jgi:hypothetical protein